MGVNVKYSDAYKFNKTQFDAIKKMWVVFEFSGRRGQGGGERRVKRGEKRKKNGAKEGGGRGEDYRGGVELP